MCTNANLPLVLARARRIAIIHHWDADGIASAAMMINWANERGIECANAAPPIGDYSDYASTVSGLGAWKPDVVVLGLDLAVTGSALQSLARQSSPSRLVWVDHHSNPPSPPEGPVFLHPSFIPADHPPSNAWFLAKLLSIPPGLLGSIGTCGDLGRTIASHPVAAQIAETAFELGLTLDQLLSLADLIDSSYRVGSHPDVEKAPRTLAQNAGHVEDLLNNKTWRANKLAVDREMHKLMSEGHERHGAVAMRTIRTRMHLASIVARQMALQEAGRAKAVIVRNLWGESVTFYIRRADPQLDLTPFIALGQGMGYSAGGKPEVVGMIVPREDVSAVTAKVMDYLEGSM